MPVAERMGAGGDVAGREDVAIAGAQRLIDQDTPVDRKPGCLGEPGARRGADPDQHRIGLDRTAVLEPDRRPASRRRDLLDPAAEDDLDAGHGVAAGEAGGERRRHGSAEQAWQDLDHGRVDAERPRARCNLEPDEAAADDGEMGARHQSRSERLGIAQIAQHVHDAFEPRRHRQAARLAPGGQQAFGVGQRAAVVEADRPLPAIDGRHRRLRAEIDAGRAQGLARGERERVDGALALQERLGQGRALIGR